MHIPGGIPSRLTVKQMDSLLAVIRARLLRSAEESRTEEGLNTDETSQIGSSYTGITADDAVHMSARQKRRLRRVASALQHAESPVQEVVNKFHART